MHVLTGSSDLEVLISPEESTASQPKSRTSVAVEMPSSPSHSPTFRRIPREKGKHEMDECIPDFLVPFCLRRGVLEYVNNNKRGMVKINEGWKQAVLRVANWVGVMYTVGLTTFLMLFGLLYLCPVIYDGAPDGECTPHYYLGVFLFFELCVNLFCFQYFKFQNQVSYWTVKSSMMLYGDSEKIAQMGRKLTFDEQVLRSQHDNQRFIMDKRSSESLRNPPAPFARLDYRDPILGVHYEEEEEEEQESHETTELLSFSNGETRVKSDDTALTKYCTACNMVTPKRCHHCPLCEMCILRKDHHCFMTGACIGLANQRYFITFIFWIFWAGLYAACYFFTYVDAYVYPWYPFGWLTYLGPVAIGRWILGYATFGSCCFAVLLSLITSSTFGAGAFFIAQMFYTLNGYTMHDYHVSRVKYHLESDGETYLERLELVFGRRWYLNFLFPLFWVPNKLTPAIAKNIFLSVSKDL